MRQILIVFTLILSVVSCSNRVVLPTKPAESAPVPFTPPELSQWRLSNGVAVIFAKSEDVPLVEAGIFFPRGSLLDSQKGSCESLGTLLRQGGTQKYAPKELDTVLEKLNAEVSSSCSDEYFNLSFASLPRDFTSVASIASEVLFTPRFDLERFNLMKSQSIELIKRRKDNPDTIAQLTLNYALFHGTPFEDAMTSSQIRNISINEIKKTHESVLQSGGALIAIAGNLDEALVRDVLENAFSKIPQKEREQNTLSLNKKATPGIYFVEDSKLTQASILIGQRSIPRGDPDRFKIEVFNYIFGLGGFSSRLMQEVRANAGLTYSIYGGSIPGLPVGQNIIGFETKVASTGEALQKAFDVLSDLKTTAPGNEELQRAKNSLINSFVFRFETPGQRVTRYALQRMLKAPINFDQTYTKEVPIVLGDDVVSVANKWWDDTSFSVVIVGPRSALNQARKLPLLRRYPVFQGTFNEVFSPS